MVVTYGYGRNLGEGVQDDIGVDVDEVVAEGFVVVGEELDGS